MVSKPYGLPEWCGRNLDTWSDTIVPRGISEVIDSHDLLNVHVDQRGLFKGDRLARRSVSRPDQISDYIAYCPADTTLDELIRIAGSRRAVEECFQSAKQECGLDDVRVGSLKS